MMFFFILAIVVILVAVSAQNTNLRDPMNRAADMLQDRVEKTQEMLNQPVPLAKGGWAKGWGKGGPKEMGYGPRGE